MIKEKVVGILNMYGEPSLGPLTSSRTLGSTSFLGRFAVMDFALSNFTNASIDDFNILVEKNFRSVAKHVGNLKSWVTNTKIGRQNILINEKGIKDPSFNTDLASLSQNDWVFYEAKADIVIITPSYVLANIDFNKCLEDHIHSGEKVSVIYTKIHDGNAKFKNGNILTIENGVVTASEPNNCKLKHVNASLNTYIVNIDVLRSFINRFVKDVAKPLTLKEAFKVYLSDGGIIHPIEVKGFIRMFDNLKSFMDISFELLDFKNAHKLFMEDAPIFTLSHDTIPTMYGLDSDVKNSFVANGAIVEGKVENSIISRRVKISKGATIKNSIILTATFIGENVIIENALIDKYAHISANKEIRGTKRKPMYIEQGKNIR